jgi:hypothetical protein
LDSLRLQLLTRNSNSIESRQDKTPLDSILKWLSDIDDLATTSPMSQHGAAFAKAHRVKIKYLLLTQT